MAGKREGQGRWLKKKLPTKTYVGFGLSMLDSATISRRLIFCDEFGNTGGRLLTTEQPVLVYAFVLIEPAALMSVGERVQLLLEKHTPAPSELKSAQLLRSPRGCRRYEEIGSCISELGARVCLSIVEKRYQACSMIVETYLDPELHEFAPLEMRERRFRQKFTDACYDTLADERLTGFLTVVDADDAQEIAAVGRRLVDTLRFHPDDFVSYAALRIETREEEVFRYGQLREGFPRNSHIPASQYAAFHPGLECVEICLRRMGATGSLLRDRDAQFGDVLDLAFAHGRELDQRHGARAYGAARQLNCIESCTSAPSAETLGIQLADLAAGLFGRLARDLLQQTTRSEDLYRIAEAWRDTLLDMERHYVMVSDAQLVGMAPAIFGRDYVHVA
jgi:hypothetical protein